MKVKCSICKRIVGTLRKNKQTILAKHRTKRGRKNKTKDTRHPICTGTGVQVKTV